MRAKRVDQNQKEIVAILRNLGVSVFHLHEVGKGCPDLLCGINGHTFLVEVKMTDGKYTKAQLEFNANWKGAQVHRITCEKEVLALVRSMLYS